MIFAAPQGVTLESKNLRRVGIEADIKAGRSFVVGPGSVHPKTGNVYRFERGGWDDFATLPCFPDERLCDLAGADDEQIAETVRHRQREIWRALATGPCSSTSVLIARSSRPTTMLSPKLGPIIATATKRRRTIPTFSPPRNLSGD